MTSFKYAMKVYGMILIILSVFVGLFIGAFLEDRNIARKKCAIYSEYPELVRTVNDRMWINDHCGVDKH